MKKRISLVVTAFAFALLLICATPSPNSGVALAQKDTASLDVRTSLTESSYQALKELPVMVSVIKEGAIVKQREVQFNSNATFPVPAGLYDVRLEGDGMQTLVKRGIHVNEGERTNIIGGPMRVGAGVKTIEYATGGLSREEIAARLAKIEAAVAELQKARQAK
jgi:hypothetical protein